MTPRGHGTGHPLSLFGAEALHWHSDVAGGAGAGVAEHIALLVGAVLVLPPLTVLPAGVRQSQRGKLRLIILPAEAEVLGKRIFSIAVVAVWAGPAKESDYFPGYFSRFTFFFPTEQLIL